MGTIVAIGMSNTDLVCRTPRLPRAGETVAGEPLEIFAGGKGANQAVAAARAGASVTFGGAVGDDDHGTGRLAGLTAAGVDVSLVQTIPGAASGVAIIVVDQRGENQIVTAAGANELVSAAELVARLAGFEYDVALLTWELSIQTSGAILKGLRHDRPIVFSVAPFDASVRDVFPDERLIVVCNEGEAAELLGRDLSRTSAVDATREIHALGCRAAIITLGAAGVAGADGDQSWTIPAPDVTVVDTTGAGDAFCGALAAWLADGSSLPDATRAGVAAGAYSVGRAGAQSSLPARAEIVQLMNQMPG